MIWSTQQLNLMSEFFPSVSEWLLVWWLSFMYFQAPASLLLSWQSSLRPVLSSSPTKPLCSVCPVCPVSLRVLQMWAGWLVGVQWAVGSPPASLFSNRTRLSTSAAICPSTRQTGTGTRFTHVKCLWAPRLQRKTSKCLTVPLHK